MTVLHEADQRLRFLDGRQEAGLYPGPSGMQHPAAPCQQDGGQQQSRHTVTAQRGKIKWQDGGKTGHDKGKQAGSDLALPHDEAPAGHGQQPQTLRPAQGQYHAQYGDEPHSHVRRLGKQPPDPVRKVGWRPPAVIDTFKTEPGVDADQEILDPCCAMIGRDLQDDVRQVRDREQQHRSMEEPFSLLAWQAGKHHGPPEPERQRYQRPEQEARPDVRRDIPGNALQAPCSGQCRQYGQARYPSQQQEMFLHPPAPLTGKDEQRHTRDPERICGAMRQNRIPEPGEDIERQQRQAQKGTGHGSPQAQTGESIHQEIPCSGKRSGDGPGQRQPADRGHGGTTGPGNGNIRHPIVRAPS